MANDTKIPGAKHYAIQQACMKLALDIQNEDSGTLHHSQRLALAGELLTPSLSANLPLFMAQVAEASIWGTTINWDTVTPSQIKTQIETIIDNVALTKFGED